MTSRGLSAKRFGATSREGRYEVVGIVRQGGKNALVGTRERIVWENAKRRRENAKTEYACERERAISGIACVEQGWNDNSCDEEEREHATHGMTRKNVRI